MYGVVYLIHWQIPSVIADFKLDKFHDVDLNRSFHFKMNKYFSLILFGVTCALFESYLLQAEQMMYSYNIPIKTERKYKIQIQRNKMTSKSRS